jgi:hypothetical protein
MRWLVGLALVAALATPGPARAQQCTGDCNNSQIIVIVLFSILFHRAFSLE